MEFFLAREAFKDFTEGLKEKGFRWRERTMRTRRFSGFIIDSDTNRIAAPVIYWGLDPSNGHYVTIVGGINPKLDNLLRSYKR